MKVNETEDIIKAKNHFTRSNDCGPRIKCTKISLKYFYKTLNTQN